MRSLGRTISTVAMLDDFVLKSISGLDVRILLSYMRYLLDVLIKLIYKQGFIPTHFEHIIDYLPHPYRHI